MVKCSPDVGVMTKIVISISDGLCLNSVILQLLMVGGGPYQPLRQDQLGSDTELSGKMSQSCWSWVI